MFQPVTDLILRMWVFMLSLSLAGRRDSPRLRGSLAKGPTFIEYAMMAAIVVVIGIILKFTLGGWFNTLFDKVSNEIGSF